MIFKILLVAALFFTATTAWPKRKEIDNPGCRCGTRTFSTKVVSTALNKAGNKPANTRLSVGIKESYPRKYDNAFTFELCTGVAPGDIYEYPLQKEWSKRKKPRKYFVIFDMKTNKFCGCISTGDPGKKCDLGTDEGATKGPGESSNPVSNPAAVH